MKKIVPFNKDESFIIDLVKDTLEKEERYGEIEQIDINEHAIYDLARSISLYPTILGTQSIGRSSRSIATLVDSLCVQDITDTVLDIPTKAILGKGFSMSKVNFFFMLLYVSRENNFEESVHSRIMDVVSNNIYTMMAEEVFLAIISDKEIDYHLRSNAAYLLANIWEYRLDHGVREFAPILNNIWRAREEVQVAYGTMLGFSEILQLSEHSDPVWFDYLQREELTDEEVHSLQEFLLGLTFEEMQDLQKYMRKRNIRLLSAEEIDQYLGNARTYPDYQKADPKDFYRSFRHRKNNATFRQRAGLPGPRKTIEEYIMSFLLDRPEQLYVSAGSR